MLYRYKPSFDYSFVLLTIVLLTACGKGKPADIQPPPVVTRTCRITNYSTTQDLGGNGSQFGFSYDQDLKLVQVTAFQLNGYPGVKVKIGASGVSRDNGASVLAWNFAVNIYSEKPSVANFTLAAGGTPEKQVENYKYDSQKRLIETDILDATTIGIISRATFTYDANDNCTSITYISGPSGILHTYYATKYDTHPSGYTNIPNREFMFWMDRWGLLSPNIKYMFDMMSAHNIVEWTHIEAASNGQSAVTEKGSFVYDFYTPAGYPQNRTESYYFNGQLKATYKDVYSYTGCD